MSREKEYIKISIAPAEQPDEFLHITLWSSSFHLHWLLIIIAIIFIIINVIVIAIVHEYGCQL